jgi:hypothetical protein
LHHITTRGNNRRSIFEDDDDRHRFYDLLDEGVAAHDVECHQDVLMGNHVHLLVGGDIAEISGLLWFVSHRYALAYNKRHGRLNHLFGRRFHSSEVPDAPAARAVPGSARTRGIGRTGHSAPRPGPAPPGHTSRPSSRPTCSPGARPRSRRPPRSRWRSSAAGARAWRTSSRSPTA